MRRSRWEWGAAVLLAATLTSASDARFSRVALLLPACDAPGLGGGELRDAVMLELAAEGLSLAPPGQLASNTDALVRLELDCDGDQASVLLSAEVSARRRERRLDLSELPPSQRARALSIALAELVATLASDSALPSEAPGSAATPPSAEPPPSTAAPPSRGADAAPPPGKASPAPAEAPPARAPAAEPSAAAVTQRANLELGIAPQLRWFDGTTLWGGRLRLARSPWSLGSDVLLSSTQVPAGGVTTLLTQVNVGHETRLLGADSGVALFAGPRVGAGLAIFFVSAAEQARGRSALDVYVDAAMSSSLALGTGRFRVTLGAEVGYARGPAGRADGVEVARTHGPFAGLTLSADALP